MEWCKWMQAVFALIILKVSLFPGIFGYTTSKWISVVAAVLILLHALFCRYCRCVSGKAVKK